MKIVKLMVSQKMFQRWSAPIANSFVEGATRANLSSRTSNTFIMIYHLFFRQEKLIAEEEAACRDLVNELCNEMMTTFNEYRIPPAFFGPFQIVNYEGIGSANFADNTEDAEYIINVGP